MLNSQPHGRNSRHTGHRRHTECGRHNRTHALHDFHVTFTPYRTVVHNYETSAICAEGLALQCFSVGNPSRIHQHLFLFSLQLLYVHQIYPTLQPPFHAKPLLVYGLEFVSFISACDHLPPTLCSPLCLRKLTSHWSIWLRKKNSTSIRLLVQWHSLESDVQRFCSQLGMEDPDSYCTVLSYAPDSSNWVSFLPCYCLVPKSLALTESVTQREIVVVQNCAC
jgi:hypothetical protein